MTSPLARRRTPQTPRPRQNGSLKVFWNMYMIMYRTFIMDKTIFWEGVAGGPLSKGGGAAHPRALRYLPASMAGDNSSAHRPERTGRWGAAVKRALQEVSCASFDTAPLTCTPAPHSISNGVVCQRPPPSHRCGGAEVSFARLPRGRCDRRYWEQCA